MNRGVDVQLNYKSKLLRAGGFGDVLFGLHGTYLTAITRRAVARSRTTMSRTVGFTCQNNQP